MLIEMRRVFLPKSYSLGESRRLTTIFTIHGGGFVLGCPEDNDDWNRKFCTMHAMLVIALNYTKAPGSPFPVPVHDVEQLILASLEDESLPIDRSRVAVSGFSAGGNLAMAVVQLPSMRNADGSPRLQAVVPLYPIVDFTISAEVKAKSRRYKPELGGFRARSADYLLGMAPKFNWAYLPKHQDLQDPILSPAFAESAALPPHIFMIGCEMDMLVHEGWRLISRLAGRESTAAVVGQEALAPVGGLIVDDPRFHFEEKRLGGSYKWLLVPDTIHGFDQTIESLVNDPALMDDAKQKQEKVMRMIGEWLLSCPFSSGQDQ
jgi:acetyl esterase/lipase